MTPAPRKVFEQTRAVDTHVDTHTGLIVRATEPQWTVTSDAEGKMGQIGFGIVPVRDSK